MRLVGSAVLLFGLACAGVGTAPAKPRAVEARPEPAPTPLTASGTPPATHWVRVEPAEPVAEVECGYMHSCLRTKGGDARCWGGGFPTGYADTPGPWAEVRAGMYQSCARDAAGAVTCWGTVGPNGEPAQAPARLPELPALRTLDMGEGDACGLDASGAVRCSGSDRMTEEIPSEDGFVALSIGFDHACALRPDGMLRCWGEGSNMDGEPPFQSVPPRWPVKQVATGLGYATCALRVDDTIGCWGGDGAGDGGSVFAGILRAPPGRYTALTVGYDHACATRPDGTVTCWGEVGDPPQSLHFRQVASGAFHACGVTTDGSVVCWGDDQFGQIHQTPGRILDEGG